MAALVGGCASTDENAVAPESPARHQSLIVAPEPLPDTRNVALHAVAGSPLQYPVSVRGGDLTMRGTVSGPDGPVAGARVLLERFVGERSGRLEVPTDARGSWFAINVHGGRYRIRAWRAPDLAMSSSDLHFIAADETVDLDLTLDRYDGADVTGGVDDATPEVGGTATVTALVTRRQVDDAGIITTAPASGREARVSAVGPWRLTGSPSDVVDADGRVSWTLTCEGEGSVSARVDALETSTTVSATCVVPVVEPPPVVEPEPDFPVGTSFTPPFAGPIPPGTYTVVDDPGTCVLTYEAWVVDRWDPSRRTVSGTGQVQIPDIARNLEALGDSPACTYERAS